MIRQYTAEILASGLPETKEMKLNDRRTANITQSFTDIYKGTIENIPDRKDIFQSNLKTSSGKDLHERSLIRKQQVKAFRDLRSSSFSRATRDNYKETSQAVNDKDKYDMHKQENAAVSSIATVLGINADELLSILKASNVETSDLIDESKIKPAVDKLADILQLHDLQKNILSEVLNMVGKIVDCKYKESMGGLAVIENSANKPWVEIANPNITVIQVQKAEADFNTLADKLKAKLNNLLLKQQVEPQSFTSEIEETVSAELFKTGLSTDESKSYLSTDSNQTEVKQDVSKASKENRNEESDNSTMDFSAVNLDKSILKENIEGTGSSQYENQIAVSSPAAGLTEKSWIAGEAAKIRNEVQIPRNELINQVVEKAKVVLTGDKSEMVMDLKPDSLGKLALKIVTEHGIVVAKFVAESYQVKEVLETNMQLLKDSLEKQGLMVQGFSVSVRQDSNRGFNGNRYPQDSLGNSIKRPAPGSSIPENMAITLENQQRSNPYRLSDNQINLTA